MKYLRYIIYLIILISVAYYTSMYITDKEKLYTYVITFLIITPIVFLILYLEFIKIPQKKQRMNDYLKRVQDS